MSGTIATYPPVLVYEVAFNAAPNQATLPPYWTDQSARTHFSWTMQRGRQYELDTNPAGTWRTGLDNRDGALDPANTASPYAPDIVPYRGCRIRAQTAPTQNLLPRVIATGTAALNPVTDSPGNWFFATGPTTLSQANYLTAAPSGQSTALAWTIPSGQPFTTKILNWGTTASGPVEDMCQVTAGLQYTASVYLSRASGGDATVAVSTNLTWYDQNGLNLGANYSGAVTIPVAPSWVRATVTATAPAGAVWARWTSTGSSPTTTTATDVLYYTGFQFEQASSVSSWADPGPTHFVYTGLVERWPQTWLLNGTYGQVNAIGVDALAQLAQYTLPPPFVGETLALGPDFFYQLNDPAGSGSCSDTAGRRVPAPVENSPFGVGSLVFGSSVTSTNPGSAFVGTPGPVGTFANSPANTPQQAQTYVSLHKTTVTPGPPTTGAWTRMIAFRCPTIPAAGTFPTVWNVNTPSYSSNQSLFQIYLNATSGTVTVQLTASGGAGPVATSPGNVCDGNWHQVAAAFDGAGYFTVYLDGTQYYRTNNGGAGWSTATGIVTDVLGCSITPGASNYSLGFVGDAAFATQFPFALTQAQVTNLYNSWRSASAGESSGARAQRVLTWVGYKGPVSIDSGQTQQMGPATDLTGATALDALNAVALTESGNFFASTANLPTFKSRASRYNQTTPVFVFGENTGGGEWPYESVTFDYDPQKLFNNVQVTQYSTSQVFTAQDTGSQALYFPRILQRTINVANATEAADASRYLVQQYGAARLRISDLLLHPSAVPGLWAVCLQLEIGTRIRVMRRPPAVLGAATVQFDGFVESVAWSLNPSTGRVEVHLQCSPADLATYWTLAALHTTLSAQAAGGQNRATINALPDAAVNKLAQSLPSGYQLTFDPGSSIAETMTIAAGGIPSTSLGYTTAQLTFTTNFQNTHSAGAVVCEPLPTGYTDPTTWDAGSKLGAASTTVLSGGGSGTNTVTVGPLADSAVNALGSNWNEGDTIWLSPGAGSFESATIQSVAATVAGYGSCQLTLTANLAHSHNPGDTVCDPLPAGVTNPAAVGATTRIAY